MPFSFFGSRKSEVEAQEFSVTANEVKQSVPSNTSDESAIKISIQYPQIQNLTYNLKVVIKIQHQKLLPRVSYDLVYTKEYHHQIQKEMTVNGLKAGNMYKVSVQLIKPQGNASKGGSSSQRGLNQTKTCFVMLQNEKGDRDETNQNIQQGSQVEDFANVAKQNIRGYFDQYYEPADGQQSQKGYSGISSLARQSKLARSQLGSANKDGKQQLSRKKPTQAPTRLPLCNSQLLVKSIGQTEPFVNSKNIEKYILEARKSTSSKSYIENDKGLLCFGTSTNGGSSSDQKSGSRFNNTYMNPQQQRKKIEKTLLVAKSVNMMNQVYEFDRQVGGKQEGGREFMQNNWFMGPFYSYDQNEKQMKKKN